MSNQCESKPFMLLGDPNKAPVLDYHIPQKTCIPMFSLKPVTGIEDCFIKQEPKPINDYWEKLKDKSVRNIKLLLRQELKTFETNFILGVHLLKNSKRPVVIYDSQSQITSGTRYQSSRDSWVRLIGTLGEPTDLQYEYKSVPHSVRTSISKQISGLEKDTYKEEQVTKEVHSLKVPQSLAIEIDIHPIAVKLSQGYLAQVVKGYADKISIKYIPRPKPIRNPIPRLYIKFEKSLCSYTANYGAGETVNTLSLLPGEKRTITVRTYQNSAYSRSRSENIIDSVSESSMNSFETAIQNSSGTSSDYSESTTETNPGEVINAGTGFLTSLFYEASATVQTPSTGEATQTHLSSMTSQVSSALSQTVNESNHFRNISVNSSSSQETQFGEENLVVREVSNINQSRTLNFVFRRLLQQYKSILILKDVKFGVVYFEGGKYLKKEVGIDKLSSLLEQFIIDNKIEDVLKKLLKMTSFVFNYNDEMKQLFVCKTYEQPELKCECDDFTVPAEKICRWILNPELEDTYQDWKFKGVILSVSEHVLKTSSLLADAFLGQGEALDCYNTNIQEQNVIGIKLNNDRTKQAIKIIDSFPTAQDKADNYKKVYGECCKDEPEE